MSAPTTRQPPRRDVVTSTRARAPWFGGASVAMATPLAAGLAVICAASALAGVIEGARWFASVVLAVSLVVAAGFVLRSLRTPAYAVMIGQLTVLLFLLTGVFTHTGLLWVPGPAAIRDLHSLLTQSVDQVQSGVPPVAGSDPIVCLVVASMGLVAVVVDTLVVTFGVPATSGLILLCVFAIPASLTDKLLPWWTFVLGASGFAGLLAADGRQRHRRWRGRVARSPKEAQVSAWPAPAAVAGIALLLALASGSWLTVVGTSGRLPGFGGSGDNGGLGLKPFTSLRGMLDQKGTSELFRVSNMTSPTYLRAMTLRKFNRNDGWALDGLSQGVVANSQVGFLPAPPGVADTEPGKVAGTIDHITIEPLGYRDAWLPVFGVPLRLDGISDQWHYDAASGIVITTTGRVQRAGRYTEHALLPAPTTDQLRAAKGTMNVDPAYLELADVDPRVVALAQQITANAATNFDKAYALNHYFTDPGNGFVYSVDTAPPATGDGLVDFLFTGKRGFCEQYASAMAVLLRAAGLPSRVALGFTAGYESNGYRVITTKDAHAWVEAYLPGIGWTTFDPTPLTDGRTILPAYLTAQPSQGQSGQRPDGRADRPSTTTTAPLISSSPTPTSTPAQGGVAQAQHGSKSSWLNWALPAMLGLATVLSLARWALRYVPPEVLAEGFRRRQAEPQRRRQRWELTLDRSLRSAIWLFVRFGWTMAVTAWMLAALLAAALVWTGLAVALALAAAVATPAIVRAMRRTRRLRAVSAGGPGAAGAAWAEVLAESWDRGAEIVKSDTVRGVARRLASEHGLDEEGRAGLRILISAVERDWYAHGADEAMLASVSELSDALAQVRRSLSRCAPLPLRAKLLPRSVLRPGALHSFTSAGSAASADFAASAGSAAG